MKYDFNEPIVNRLGRSRERGHLCAQRGSWHFSKGWFPPVCCLMCGVRREQLAGSSYVRTRRARLVQYIQDRILLCMCYIIIMCFICLVRYARVYGYLQPLWPGPQKRRRKSGFFFFFFYHYFALLLSRRIPRRPRGRHRMSRNK